MTRTKTSQSQKKWDLRYSAQAPMPAAAEVLTRNQHLLPPKGKGLDVACGLGANSLFLAQRGLQMEARDISPIALAALDQRAVEYNLPISTRWTDLESACQLKAGHYDLIVASRYLHRPLCQTLVTSLAEHGLLFYQTFTVAQNEVKGRVTTLNGPRTHSYKLQANELLRLFASLETIYHHEDIYSREAGRANMAYYVGRKG